MLLLVLGNINSFVQINCYDILGENDVKTEATLQVRLEQARECAPCLLVMRHLEALSQTTQAAEPGKGMETKTCGSLDNNFFFAEPAIVGVLKEALDNIQNGWRLTGYPVIVLGTTSESGRVPANLLSCFKQEVAFEVSRFYYWLIKVEHCHRRRTRANDWKSWSASSETTR